MLAFESFTLTLISGDQVVVTNYPNGSQTTDIIPAKLNDYISSFNRITTDNELYIIPKDYLKFIPHILHKELFNITKLVNYEYYDEQMLYIPLIITLKNKVSTKDMKHISEALLDIVDVQHYLFSIDSVAVHVNKNKVHLFIRSLFNRKNGSLHGTEFLDTYIKNIRLDGQVKTAL